MLQDNHWIRRTKWLTHALIISGTLNIGLIATFAYFVLKEKQDILSLELKPAGREATAAKPTNTQLLHAYSLLPYQELLLRLENKELLEEGLTRRDLGLACLVAFHLFNLDKALGGLPLQKRIIPFTSNDGQETIDISIFPGLADYQFQAILQYAKTEKWPFTSLGLLHELKRSPLPRDLSLLDAFYLTPEYHAVYTLLTKTGIDTSREQIIDLISESEWNPLSDLNQKQRTELDLTPDRRRFFLLDSLQNHSKLAAKLLLDTDSDFVSKRLDDAQILTLLDFYPDKTPTLENFAKELLSSPRTDTLRKRAASLLFALAGEPLPEPYDHQLALHRFLPQSQPPAPMPITPTKAPIPPNPKKIHTVEPGDSLWKIARKYHVTIEELMRVNRLETEKLRPGKQLEIPDQKNQGT
jgi:hypothetical protein